MNNKTIFIDYKDELLTSYLKDISKYKVLNSSEVAILVSKAQSGDEKARTELITSNLRFVVTIAESDVYCGSGIDRLGTIEISRKVRETRKEMINKYSASLCVLCERK